VSKLSGSTERHTSLLRGIGADLEFGAYDPGQWLKLIDLQRRHRATQFEVRQVLRELKGRGLVEHRPNYGFRVARPDPLESARITYVRVALERSAAQLIIERAVARDVADLAALSRAFMKSIRMPGRHRQASANQAFHDRLFAMTGNPVLTEEIRALRSRYYASAGRWRRVQGLRESGEEHERMITAIRRQDRSTHERLIVHHVRAFSADAANVAKKLA